MLRIERQRKQFTRLDRPKLAEAALTERFDLEEFIFNSPKEFFAEVGEDFFVIGKEIRPSEVVEDRIDLLGLDPEGNAVIVELKRGNDRLQLLQAIAYAGMVAKWKVPDFLARVPTDRQETLADFLDVDVDEINRAQRIILVAEAYDFEVLVGAEWLRNNYELDIICCRIGVSTDPAAHAEYLSCTQVFPAPELEGEAVQRRRRPVQSIPWEDWDQAIGGVSNKPMADYYQSQLLAHRESYLPDRALFYRVGGKRRWFLSARDNRAYCWQYGRFEGDADFWTKRLSDADSVRAVKQGTRLRFFLSTTADFAAFDKAVTLELLGAEWRAESNPAMKDEGPPTAERLAE